MENLTLFDVGIFLAILFAMLLSSMPNKLAMFICLAVSIAGLTVNGVIEAGYLGSESIYPIAGVIETTAAIVLLVVGSRVIKHRQFFYVMAGFLLASSALNSIYIPVFLYTDFLSYEFYTYGFHIVAVLHVITMYAYSDGIGKIAGNIRGSILGDNPNRLGIRD